MLAAMIAAAQDSSSGRKGGCGRLLVVDHQIVARPLEQGVKHGIQVEGRLRIAGQEGIGIGGIGDLYENA